MVKLLCWYSMFRKKSYVKVIMRLVRLLSYVLRVFDFNVAGEAVYKDKVKYVWLSGNTSISWLWSLYDKVEKIMVRLLCWYSMYRVSIKVL